MHRTFPDLAEITSKIQVSISEIDDCFIGRNKSMLLVNIRCRYLMIISHLETNEIFANVCLLVSSCG